LRKEELAAFIRGRSEARAKSSASALSLGCERDLEEVLVELPTNWAARSLYWVCRLCSASASVSDALFLGQVAKSVVFRGIGTMSLLPPRAVFAPL
jgi:hypothetical protein